MPCPSSPDSSASTVRRDTHRRSRAGSRSEPEWRSGLGWRESSGSRWRSVSTAPCEAVSPWCRHRRLARRGSRRRRRPRRQRSGVIASALAFQGVSQPPEPAGASSAHQGRPPPLVFQLGGRSVCGSRFPTRAGTPPPCPVTGWPIRPTLWEEKRAEDGDSVTRSAAISLPMASDAALVHEAASDPTRFAALYQLYVDDLYRYLLSRCGDHMDAEDLVAETFLAAFRAARAYRGTGPVKAWLVGIARRKAADARRGKRVQLDLDAAVDLADPIRTDDLALQRVELARVLAMTDRLAPDRAEALRLRFFAGLDSAEIAPIMGRSEAAVKMLVHRALTDLREQLEATK